MFRPEGAFLGPKASVIPSGHVADFPQAAAAAGAGAFEVGPSEASRAGAGTPARRERFRFEGIEVDTALRELRRGHTRLPLAPKPFHLLLLLLAHRDRSLSRAEILAHVWPSVHVSEATLASTLRDLRRVLGDEGKRSRLIRTIRGVGLRFIAPVEEVPLPPERDAATEAFVGRDEPLRWLHSGLAAAARGQGSVLFFSGEPGIGKTRLTEEFAREARAGGGSVYFGRCPESGAALSYRPWAELLGALVESRSAEEIAEWLGPGAVDLAQLVPQLGIEPAEACDNGEASLRLFDSVSTLLRRAARRAPIAIVLDDLHRADRVSLRLLEFVASELAEARVLLVGAHRNTELVGDHPLVEALSELARHPRFERHPLSGLSEPETLVLAAREAGRRPPPEVVQAIHARTGGNPFFVRELARQWARVPGEAAADGWGREVPANVCELVRDRLRRLSGRSRGVLDAASVIGRDFAIAPLRRVTGLDEDALLDALEEAQRAGLVETRGEAPRFVHALVQEAIYAKLADASRAVLHRRAGEALEAEDTDLRREHLPEIARHFASGGDPSGGRALDSALLAAEQAERQLAHEEAARLYEMALEHVAPADRARRCDLLLALARVWLRARDVERAWQSARRAADLARALRSPERLARAAIALADHLTLESAEVVPLLEEALAEIGPEPSALRVRLSFELARQLRYLGQPERKRRLAAEAVRMARRTGDGRVLAAALLVQHDAIGPAAALAERLRIAAEVVEWADAASDPVHQVFARSLRCLDLLEAGELAAADRDAAAAASIAEQHRLFRFLGFAPRYRSLRACMEGRFADAVAEAGASLALMARVKDPNAQSYFGSQLGCVLYEQGRYEELDAMTRAYDPSARARVPVAMQASFAMIDLELGRERDARALVGRLAADGFAALEDDADGVATAAVLATLCLHLSDAEAAARLYEWMAPYDGRHVVFGHGIACRGAVAHYLGLLARTRGCFDEAERHFEEAIAANRALSAAPYVAKSQLECAELLRARGRDGDRARLRELAEQARAQAERLRMARLAARASALLAP